MSPTIQSSQGKTGRQDRTTKDLDDLHRMAKSARQKFDPIWYMNLAYFRGNQWLTYGGDRLFKPEMPRHRITIVDNRIMPAVNTEIAKMTKTRPVFVVSPRSGDEEDRNAAELGEQIMEFLWEHLQLHEKNMEALRWSRVCGAGFLKCFWDDTVGDSREVMMDSQGQVVPGPDGRPLDPRILGQMPQEIQQQLVVRIVCQGDVRVEARSPFQMFVDPLATELAEAEWLIEESVKSADYVYRRYNVELEADTPANPSLIDARTASPDSRSGAYKGLKIREYWSKPNRQHPNGYRAVWCKDKMLDQDDSPHDPMPYIMYSGVPIPGQFWPTCVTEQLRGPQTELNKIKSQLAENRNRVGNPTILASKQAVQDPDKFLDSMTTPGGTYFYDDVGSQNTVPTYLAAPPMPEYVINSIQFTEESMQEISGQHEVSSAQVPPGVTAASAINLLLEADDTRLGPAITDFEINLGRLGAKLLDLVARYYTDARTIRIAGQNGSWQIFDFRGSQLRDNTAVEVQSGSGFPRSKAAKQAAMQDLLTFSVQSGNPLHGKQLAEFFKDWEVGGGDALVADFTDTESQCDRENVLMAQGRPLEINSYDDDQAHIDAHMSFQRSARYAQLPPPTKQIFEQHVILHRQRLQQQQQAALATQMQMEGQPSPQQQGQQLQMDLAGQAQGVQGAAQQQGFQQAGQEQQQRQAEQTHQQQMQQRDEQHAQRLQHAQEQHEARLRAQAQQASRGGPSGR